MADSNLERMFAKHGVPVVKTNSYSLPPVTKKKKTHAWKPKPQKVKQPPQKKEKHLSYVPASVIARQMREIYGEHTFNIEDHKDALEKWKAKKMEQDYMPLARY
jgi:hypothetical protein